MRTDNGHISHSVVRHSPAFAIAVRAHAKLSVKNKYSEVVCLFNVSEQWLVAREDTQWPSFKEDMHAFMHAHGTAIS